LIFIVGAKVQSVHEKEATSGKLALYFATEK